jgi:SOS-response transcriptional repressor LexA
MTGAGIDAGDLLIVDRAAETCDGHIVVARIGNELCVKRLCIERDGKIWLMSANDEFPTHRDRARRMTSRCGGVCCTRSRRIRNRPPRNRTFNQGYMK